MRVRMAHIPYSRFRWSLTLGMRDRAIDAHFGRWAAKAQGIGFIK